VPTSSMTTDTNNLTMALKITVSRLNSTHISPHLVGKSLRSPRLHWIRALTLLMTGQSRPRPVTILTNLRDKDMRNLKWIIKSSLSKYCKTRLRPLKMTVKRLRYQ
jgi:hypothetical protein